MANPAGSNTEASVDKGVQDRLLDVGEELFCEHGFDGTSVRDLAAAAHCNIASVNYYFGGKENLYIEVWRRHLKQMREGRITAIKNVMSRYGGKPPLEELLRVFANAFVGPLTDESKARQLINLHAREMFDQHLPANMFIREIVVPTLRAMGGALERACPGLDESKTSLVLTSIIAQLVHAVHAMAMFDQTASEELPKLHLADAIDHIVRFSAAGVRAYMEGGD